MPAPRKLTDEQIAWARQVVEKRREAMRQVRMYPSLEELAEQLGCSKRYLLEILKFRARSKRVFPLLDAEERKRRANVRSYANAYQRRGKIQKSDCEKCGDPNSEKHHDDYDEPLQVRWLCRACHMAEHEEANSLTVEPS